MAETTAPTKQTCLNAQHRALGARMVPFAGWDMPVQYHGIIEEHKAVRTAAGMFDVSHMGRISFSGPDSIPYLQRLFTCDVAALQPGNARYTLLCVESGGILDDTILYCRWPDSFELVCNAANTPAVLDWLQQWKGSHRVELVDRTSETGMIALQGPAAAEHLAAVGAAAAAQGLKSFQWAETTVAGSPAMIARTGYTGEDGFEIITDNAATVRLWQQLVERGVAPCGLGARDTLRLEAALPLHGNDISLETNPVEAGLLWTVALDKGAFLGSEAIQQAKAEGTPRHLVGFEMLERAIPRSHHPLLAEGRAVGMVTSGGFAPTLQKGIGMGYVESAYAKPGLPIQVDIRGTLAPAQTVRRPFYKRAG